MQSINRTINIYTDGGSRGNPGPSALGVYICQEDGTEITSIKKRLGIATNNIAEYQAVLHAYYFLDNLESLPTNIVFYLDSLLVTQQLKGVFKIKNKSLLDIRLEIAQYERKLFGKKVNIEYIHIFRKFNKKADFLVNQALDFK